MKKTQILMNEPPTQVYLYEFWYYYMRIWRNKKHGKKAKLCYMDIDRFIVYEKTKEICTDIKKRC